MSAAKLKEDLKNCLITFDSRVVLTELLDDYDLLYEEVNSLLVEYLQQQENKGDGKYEKRYVVHGFQELAEIKKEIYKIVEEPKLQEWLNKLKNAESSLYSIEIAGGAKAAAAVFKPFKLKEGVKKRKCLNAITSNNDTAAEATRSGSTSDKKEIKKEDKNSVFQGKANTMSKDLPKPSSKPQTPVKKSPPPKVESSPTTKKSTDKKSNTNSKKGGINNFFAPAANKKPELDKKDTKTTLKPPTPKKMQDFFKKQADKPKSTTAEAVNKEAANKSIQLFEPEDEEEEEPTEEVSSDEEEKIEALKRDIISSDVEMDATEETDKPCTSVKRRRILDSDDEEEDPPVKQEKIEAEEEEVVVEPDTYLDEEGFVITKKPKQKATVAKPRANKTTPAVTLKTSTKDNKKSSSSPLASTSKDTKAAAKPGAKTKQVGIMSFFGKK